MAAAWLRAPPPLRLLESCRPLALHRSQALPPHPPPRTVCSAPHALSPLLTGVFLSGVMAVLSFSLLVAALVSGSMAAGALMSERRRQLLVQHCCRCRWCCAAAHATAPAMLRCAAAASLMPAPFLACPACGCSASIPVLPLLPPPFCPCSVRLGSGSACLPALCPPAAAGQPPPSPAHHRASSSRQQCRACSAAAAEWPSTARHSHQVAGQGQRQRLNPAWSQQPLSRPCLAAPHSAGSRGSGGSGRLSGRCRVCGGPSHAGWLTGCGARLAPLPFQRQRG